ncbi:MAG: ABC transporter ATP-binding protein [Solirubrobacteraceae bacterium]
MPLVEVHGLRKRYAAGAPEAVAGIDFAVREGEIFGLLGPNGAGKTTTIGAITTRVKPTGGRVTVDGFDVARDPVAVKQRIAVVPQRPNLDRSLTAMENLVFHAAYFGEPRGARRRRAQEMLDRMGLGDRGADKVDEYSGGMAQRLMIARALMHEPRLLVLDEPTVGLDPQSRLFLWAMMTDLRARGVTLMLTTHDMVEADRLCDRIAIVDHGRIIALDTPRGLRRLLPAQEGLEVTLAGPQPLEIEAERIDGRADDDRWHARIYGALTPSDLAAAVRDAGRELIELRRVEGSLEDVFVHLTGRELR